MKRLARLAMCLFAAGSSWLLASRLSAADPAGYQERMRQMHQNWVEAGMPRQTAPLSTGPDIVAAGVYALSIPAYAFTSASSTDLILEDGNGYRYLAPDPASRFLVAPVQLPSGALVETLGISGCLHFGGDIQVQLVDDLTNGQPSVVVANFDTAEAGCIYEGTSPNYTYAQNGGHPLLAVVYWAGNFFDGSTKFNEVYISYQRQISPAPATPHFNDVPTSDSAFQYVEALLASGITGGCGGGNYCPDSPVTRRQMAVFLAKALGLYWHD